MHLTLIGREGFGGRRPPKFPAVTALLLSGVVALSTACAPASAPARSTVPPPSLPPIYAAIYGTVEESRVINTAEWVLVSRCMENGGFTFQSSHPREAGAPDRPRPFGLESLDQPVTTQENGVAEKPGSVSSEYIRALYGDKSERITARGSAMKVSRPVDGCQAQSETHLLGEKNRQRWMETRIRLYEAELEAQKWLQKAPEFNSLNTRWRTCMKRAGFAFRDPMGVVDGLPPKANFRAEPSARADIACKSETDYLFSAYTGLAAAQRKVLERSPHLLVTWTTLLRQQCSTAQMILAESGTDPDSDASGIRGGPYSCPDA